MPEFQLRSSDAILVALGGVSGSWLRFKIAGFFQSILLRKYWGTCFVNLAASFSMGLLLVFFPECHAFNYSNSVVLFIGVGFLGGLSTFSSFIMDLIQTFSYSHFRELFILTLCSIFGGLLTTYAGYILSCG